ncbi:sensor histidine kinase [Paenibacillus sp. JX-17]|uniref:Sensor histidine kinase n=1 Tax=Paenibacillus lacisoli TaxID=3064525 RepID=A0ABT9CC38_9BACL|nr:sensor histidine kinase [Paenibacillus sp. JX-17]MDO7906830.1 sensor histidine kinase [Paenibacillus sp. JX-17]
MSGIVLCVSLLFYNRATTQFQNKVSDLSQKNVSQTANLFELLLNGYDSLSKSISNNMDLVRLLSQPGQAPAVSYINERTITNMIGAIYYSREDLTGIHILTDTGKVYNYGNFMNVVNPDYPQTDWYQEIKRSAGKIVWLGVYPRSIIDEMEDKPVFAFGRQIYDLNEHRPIGIVLFETDPKSILSALDNLRLGPNSEVFLMGHDHRVVSATTSNPPPSLQGLEDDDGQMKVERRGDEIVIASKLPFANWSVISVTPNHDLNVELAQTQRYMLIMVPILIVVSALIALFVSRSISMPLKRLVREMKEVENGNFTTTLQVSSFQEIDHLVVSFNHMVGRIEELIELVKISSVSEKNAELHALQSQVNPHFLYNTLDMIYWMLDEKGQDHLGDVVLSLSHMFRYSSHWEEGDRATLRGELEQTGHYLTIIKARLEGRLEVSLEVDESWMDIQLPKMTLQPLIENAVKHGLEPLPGEVNGLLRVRTATEGSVLHIIVEDNGVGMSAARLLELKSLLAGVRHGGHTGNGIGLENLNLRLRHMYGEDYGMDIYSGPDVGTKIVVSIPLPLDKGEVCI